MAIIELFLNEYGNIPRKGNIKSFNPGVENTLTQAKGRTHHAIELYLLVNWKQRGDGGVPCPFSLFLVFFFS